MARLAAPLLLVPLALAAPEETRSDAATAVRILESACWDCHAGANPEADLALDSREGLLRGGSRGPAIDLEQPERSRILRALARTIDFPEMPPDAPLPPEEIARIRAWIGGGAPWPDAAEAGEGGEATWWAFRPLGAADAAAGPASTTDLIDEAIEARRAEANLAAVAPAERTAILRRVTFDLTGLPPTPEEVDSFLADQRADAYEHVVDRLLASQAFGERWGRFWLDLARYADTAGDSSDYPIEDAWRYRDYVIRSFNEDLPYDEFLREQIAGDVLAAEDPGERFEERIVATGFLALSRRFGVGMDQSPHLVLEDTIDTLGRAVLGLTMRCARCHDHKFDPITSADYYALYGIFGSTTYPFPGSENEKRPERLVPLVPPAEVAAAQRERERRTKAAEAVVQERKAELDTLTARVEALAKEAAAVEADARALSDPAVVSWTPRRADRSTFHLDPSSGLAYGSGFAETTFRARFRCTVDIEACVLGWSDPQVSLKLDGATIALLDDGSAPAFLPRWVRARDVPLAAGDHRLRFSMNGREVGFWGLRIHRGALPPDEIAALHSRAEELRRNLAEATELRKQATESFERARAEASRIAAAAPSFPTAYAVTEGKPRDAHVQLGGEPGRRGEIVPRGVPRVLLDAGPAFPPIESGSGRRELANWLVHPDHPLTARVFVNRVWQRLFGRGLAETPSNFGKLGARPSHPELLDLLARRFVAEGWSVKRLIRSIVHSHTYRLSSAAVAAGLDRDPTNVLQWRHSRRRLDAEELRDALRAIAGLLRTEPAGPHPFPPRSEWRFTQHDPFRASYENDNRCVYEMQGRLRRDPFLALFDGANPNEHTAERGASIVPGQALYFLNSKEVHRAADAFATRLERELPEACDSDLFARAVLYAWGRQPSEEEEQAACSFLEQYRSTWCAEGGAREAARHAALAALGRVLFASDELLYLD